MIKGIRPSLAEGGKIKIGGLGDHRKSKSGQAYRMPVKFDHFVVTRTTRNDSGDLEPNIELMSRLPVDRDGHCREIPIVVHSDEIDEVFPTAYAMYAGKRLVCRGNGESAERWETDPETKIRKSEPVSVQCTCPYLGAKSGPVCKPHGILHCSIRVPGMAVAGSVYRWRTTSLISIQRMIGSMQQILATCGGMAGLPLLLRLEPIQVAPDGGSPTTVYCCHIELRAKDIVTAQTQVMHTREMRAAMSGGCDPSAYRALLRSPGVDEYDSEAEEVAQEFHPDTSEHLSLHPGTHKL